MEDTKDASRHVERLELASVPKKKAVYGTTEIFHNGRLRLIPAPSPHPDDPLLLPTWRKALAIISVCLFGALSVATQQVIAGLLPVFMLEYAGIDPHVLNQPRGLMGVLMSHLPHPPDTLPAGIPRGTRPAMPSNFNPLEALGKLPGAQPLSRVNLLSSLPLLLIGISNYFLVPAAIVFGRRAVMLLCGVIATACSIWAGVSTSLPAHLAARSVHAIGAGCIESLIPLIVQDVTYLHCRSRAMSSIALSQGLVGIALGIGSTYIVATLSWRWLYFINAILTGAALLLMVFFLPETRWNRTAEELSGQMIEEASCESSVPASPTVQARYGLFANGGIRAKDGAISLIAIFKTFSLPIVLYMILINAIFMGANLGSNLTSSTVLLAPPYNWPIQHVGLSVIAVFTASLFVALIGGLGSDALTSWLAKQNGGIREAEHNLWNMIAPITVGAIGCVLFGIGGELVYKVHWMALISGVTMLTFAFLMANLVSMVLCVESYPMLAGPILVNVSSFRNIIGFAFTYGVPEWVSLRGSLLVFGIFAGLHLVLGLLLPVFYRYGKCMRTKTAHIAGSTDHSL